VLNNALLLLWHKAAAFKHYDKQGMTTTDSVQSKCYYYYCYFLTIRRYPDYQRNK